ncbi:hypothetical protein KRP22_000974 [Phytophthora ramorum]|nr:hypothetical protein KRP22_289 [Phytophthora ramorum]
MAPAQTQSLPVWAPAHALPSATCKPTFEDEDPLYLSGEETDCDSERGSDTLSREDQQLMASFIRLQRERARKQVFQHQVSRPAVACTTTPVLIPAQSRQYVPTSTKQWIWDEVEEDCDQCPCCCNQSENRPASAPADEETATDVAAVSDLMFDLEL